MQWASVFHSVELIVVKSAPRSVIRSFSSDLLKSCTIVLSLVITALRAVIGIV